MKLSQPPHRLHAFSINPRGTDMSQKSESLFNNEESNTTSNPAFEQVLETRLSRRSLFRGAGLAGAAVGAASVTGCATTMGSGSATQLDRLGFKAVPKSLADKVIVPEGYTAQVIYALGDPLAAGVAPFKNDGTDTQFEQRAGDHHDGMEWFGLDASGKPSDSFNSYPFGSS